MKIFKISYYIIIISLVIIAILLIVSIFPITGNIKFLIVQSGSMMPEIKMGSIIMVKPAKEYKIGDIITFSGMTKTQELTTHRVHDIKVIEGKPIYITKGDANNASDRREIKKNEIIGKVFFNIPYLGYAVDFARKPLGFALIIIIPATAIIGGEIKKILAEAKKRKTKNFDS